MAFLMMHNVNEQECGKVKAYPAYPVYRIHMSHHDKTPLPNMKWNDKWKLKVNPLDSLDF